MDYLTTEYDGNPHIGLYARACEKLAVLPIGAPNKFTKVFEGFGKVMHTTIAGSNLVGIFMCMNSNGALLPSFAEEEEKKFFKGLGMNVCLLPSIFAAAGNNVCANDKGALLNPDISREFAKKIGDCLGVEVQSGRIANHKTVGSCCVATKAGFAAHNRASEEEMEMMSSLFGVKGLNVSVNMGSPFVGLGVVANSKGCVIGEATSGFEASRVQSALSGE